MGRSVSYPNDTLILTFSTYETGYEAEAHDVEEGYAETVGEWIDNEFAFDDVLEDLRETCKSMWPSLYECDEWLDREDHAVMQNGLVQVGVSEYCGLLSYWVVARGDAPEALAARWADQIREAFTKTFGTLVKLGNMSNGEGVYKRVA